VGRLAATANSMLLHKALRNRMWDDSRHVARQLPGIGSLLADRLAAAGIDHLRKLQDTDPRRIETVTQRHYPFGKNCLLWKCVRCCITRAAPDCQPIVFDITPYLQCIELHVAAGARWHVPC